MATEEQYVLQVSYDNQQSKCRRLYTTRSGICTWAKFIATIKCQIEYLLEIDIEVQYKDPDTGVWIVLSRDDRDITDLLDRTKQQNKYKMIECLVFEGSSPQVCIQLRYTSL